MTLPSLTLESGYLWFLLITVILEGKVEAESQTYSFQLLQFLKSLCHALSIIVTCYSEHTYTFQIKIPLWGFWNPPFFFTESTPDLPCPKVTIIKLLVYRETEELYENGN